MPFLALNWQGSIPTKILNIANVYLLGFPILGERPLERETRPREV